MGIVTTGLRTQGGNFIAGITPSASVALGYVTSSLKIYLDASNPSSYPGVGTTWTDTVGGYQFKLTGSTAPTYTASYGGNIVFNGTNQYAYSLTTQSFAAPSFSVEAWHYYTGVVSGNGAAIVAQQYDTSINYVLGTPDPNINTAPSMSVGYYNSATGWYSSTQYKLTTGSWYQIVGTYDTSNLKLYVNGVNVATTPSNGVAVNSSTPINLMKRWDLASVWGGSLGIIRIYNAALTQAQVTQNYNANKARYNLV